MTRKHNMHPPAADYIFNDDFLLQSKSARELYHDYAAHLPIIDYHNHLSPKEIADNNQFSNLTEVWLRGDHYKWRAMRALGIEEKWITGEATDLEKFKAFAACVPQTVRNPLFHWVHMELKHPFGVQTYLNKATAEGIYTHCSDLLQEEGYRTRGLLRHFQVQMVCTTDDPCDTLADHQKGQKVDWGFTLMPGFRPDKILKITDRETFFTYLQELSMSSGMAISDFDSLLAALQQRVDYFHAAGCRMADHGLSSMPAYTEFPAAARAEFKVFIGDKSSSTFSHPEHFAGALLKELCIMYHAKGWVQQFHLGAMRNNNSRYFQQLGPDSGYDSIGDDAQAKQLAQFLNELDNHQKLTKTIIYNLNPSHNEVFASMAGNFNEEGVKGKIQFGSGWWFLDQLDGMEKQMNAYSSIGIISTFVGMLTDSRSFLSFSRHAYFRRLLCNLFGDEMEKGLLPNDKPWIGSIVQDICYFNAKAYFNL